MKNQLFVLLAMSGLALLSCKSETISDPLIIEPVKEWGPDSTRSITGYFAERGLKKHHSSASDGYILCNPAASSDTYLLNKSGEVVHVWESDLCSMQGYLKENGNLVRLERDIDFPVFAAGGQAGMIREYDWDGNKIWEFEYATDKVLLHHDIELKPNGNILAISYDALTYDEAVAAGRDPANTPKGGIWLDKVIEVKPNYPVGGDIVWEWRMRDHLVQDFDETKDNYGVVADHPERINFNIDDEPRQAPPPQQIEQIKKMGWVTSNASADTWNSDISHVNAIVYNPELEQIAISSPEYSEIFIIDQSTTTEEAKSEEGGKYGQGGALLYRWGNPENYDRGTEEDRQLYYQHDVRWIPEGVEGAGSLLVFNNGVPNYEDNMEDPFQAFAQSQSPDPQIKVSDVSTYSAVYQIKPPITEEDTYTIEDDKAFGPDGPEWVYTAPDTLSFFSPFVSGAERLQNGHMLILSGAQGQMFEINKEKQIVWEYWNPYFHDYKLPDGSPAQPVGPFIFAQYRVKEYPKDYSAFKGKSMAAITPQPETFTPEPFPGPSKAEDLGQTEEEDEMDEAEKYESGQ
ncbi:MAG: hypothetical protein HKN09_04290 [Saprospiraceae bacterium]|nr:hypothetical protein [Saprospiraceae bacterium]